MNSDLKTDTTGKLLENLYSTTDYKLLYLYKILCLRNCKIFIQMSVSGILS